MGVAGLGLQILPVWIICSKTKSNVTSYKQFSAKGPKLSCMFITSTIIHCKNHLSFRFDRDELYLPFSFVEDSENQPTATPILHV